MYNFARNIHIYPIGISQYNIDYLIPYDYYIVTVSEKVLIMQYLNDYSYILVTNYIFSHLHTYRKDKCITLQHIFKKNVYIHTYIYLYPI